MQASLHSYHHRVEKVHTTKCSGNEWIDRMATSGKVHHSLTTYMGKDITFTEFN